MLVGISAFSHFRIALCLQFPQNWASFDEALREKFSCCGCGFLGYFFAIPFRYFGLVIGVTASVKVQDNCV